MILVVIKIYGDDLKTLETKGDEVVAVMKDIRGVEDLGLFRVLGQPNLDFSVDRDDASRYGISVSDVQDAIRAAASKAYSGIGASLFGIRQRGTRENRAKEKTHSR